MGRPSDPDYWKKWRAANPEYRARERARSKARKRTTEQRRAERERAKQRSIRKAEYTERQRKRSREYKKARGYDPERRRREYEKYKDKILWDQKFRNQRAEVRKKLEIADEAIASVGVRPDGRVLYDEGLYDDARGAAILAVLENANRPRRFKLAAAKTAVKNVVKQHRSEQYRTVSLDQPIPGTEGLTYADTLEGDWY